MTNRRRTRPLAAARGAALAAALTAGAAGCTAPLQTAPVLPVPSTEAPTTAPPTAAPTTAAPTTAAPTTAAPTTTAPPSPLACTAELPLRTRIAQVLMPFIEGDQLDLAAAHVAQWNPGGVLLMTWPEGAPDDGLHTLQQTAAIPLHIAVDEEGGTVQRLRRLGRLPSASEVAATMSTAEAEVHLAPHTARAADLGITMVFAPVVDVAPDAGSSGADTMGSRTFGSDPAVVGEYAAAQVRAWQSVGIIPVLKHFPGHGRATADTHDARATTPPLDELRTRDLVPYRNLVGLAGVEHPSGAGAGVMVGHLDVPGLTDTEPSVNAPASLSRAAITGLLRDELGYADALVVTDALNMGAITSAFTTADAALAALAAGSDIVLYAGLDEAAGIVERIELALLAGQLSPARLDEAASRVLRSKGMNPCELLRKPGR